MEKTLQGKKVAILVEEGRAREGIAGPRAARYRRPPMAAVTFTQSLQRHVACPPREVSGRTLREVLDAYFEAEPAVRGYIVDEQGALRRHVVVFVDGQQIRDRTRLAEEVGEGASVYVMQALSGG
jgi:sulfur-carrier protein